MNSGQVFLLTNRKKRSIKKYQPARLTRNRVVNWCNQVSISIWNLLLATSCYFEIVLNSTLLLMQYFDCVCNYVNAEYGLLEEMVSRFFCPEISHETVLRYWFCLSHNISYDYIVV